MKELEVKLVKKTPGFMPNLKVRAFQMEIGDSSFDITDEGKITKDEFHSILEKASKPIKKSGKEKS